MLKGSLPKCQMKKEQNWYRKRIANVTENAKYLHGIACHLLNTTQDCKRSAENVLLKTKRMRNIAVTMCSLAALHTSAETATTEDNVRTLLCRFTAKNVDLQRNANDGWCSATHQKPGTNITKMYFYGIFFGCPLCLCISCPAGGCFVSGTQRRALWWLSVWGWGAS